MAQQLGVSVIGTVGVLVLAKRRGLLPHLRPLLESLIASGYFLTPDLVSKALLLAGE